MQKVVILGGSGFVGRTLCELLARQGVPVVVPSRRRRAARHLLPLPNVTVLEADAHDPTTLDGLLQGADAVVNLIAILQGSPQRFQRVHVDLVQTIADACLRQGVPRLLHVSALGVPDDQPDSAPSNYLRSKARGEQVLARAAAQGLQVAVLRPSVIFGCHDKLLNLFAALQRAVPVVPLAGADARFAPVWVGDVAQALVQLLHMHLTSGRVNVWEACGPQEYTLAGIVQTAGELAGCSRPILPLPHWAAYLQALAMECLPGEPLMSRDNLASMRVPNVATGRHAGLPALGVQAAEMRGVASTYLRH
ncbi:complex I NDUFA9 subunit family protein [Curvibacter sp. APW13]|uniref:complex I NDUFA9 subunit family protein n=1 Tax=Curvibacter sp. APW13 TaxID=3077236 RepID=UPI0028DF85DF|nr:complex I NDUFA9 subunit family protein [Curvibacter sp. APW13]MDT8990882.1 complex I NDUFA9 subunit family protein [Curvibacter sp. APW13]